jgi:hypothetical protein
MLESGASTQTVFGMRAGGPFFCPLPIKELEKPPISHPFYDISETWSFHDRVRSTMAKHNIQPVSMKFRKGWYKQVRRILPPIYFPAYL